MSAIGDPALAAGTSLLDQLGDEGLRLFFPLSALHAAFWPLLWVIVQQFDLALATHTSPFIWHGYELLVGSYGAALIGFITTAVPEWTGTRRPRNRPLFILAGLWASARFIGLLGADALLLPALLLDLGWLIALPLFVLKLSVQRRTDRLMAFIFWLSLFAGTATLVRIGMLAGDMDLAAFGLRLTGLTFLGILGLALARINVPVTNQILDPTEETSPYRPHPGRMNLASGLCLVALAALVAGLSPAVTGFLLLAAGAAFLDRIGDGLIWPEALRAELLALNGSSAAAGAGLLLWGASLLGADTPEIAGLHLALMGGLGLGIMAVFCIAGLLHTGRPLGLPRAARLALGLIALATVLRLIPALGYDLPEAYGLSSLAWAGGFLIWLITYLPWFREPVPKEGC